MDARRSQEDARAGQGKDVRETSRQGTRRSTGAVKYKAMVEGIRFRFIDQPAGVQKKLARKAKRSKKK